MIVSVKVSMAKAHSEQPKFGTIKGKVTTLDPDWWKPMTGDEVEGFAGDR